MDIEEIHVGMRYQTAEGRALVTGIDRDSNSVHLESLEQVPLGLPLPGFISCSTSFALPCDQVYEEISE